MPPPLRYCSITPRLWFNFVLYFVFAPLDCYNLYPPPQVLRQYALLQRRKKGLRQVADTVIRRRRLGLAMMTWTARTELCVADQDNSRVAREAFRRKTFAKFLRAWKNAAVEHKWGGGENIQKELN